MRTIRAATISALTVTLSSVACTSLLGDFEITAQVPDGGGGADVVVAPVDAPTDTPTAETASEAGNPVVPLNCVEVPTSKRKLGVLQSAGINNMPSRVLLGVYPNPLNNNARAVAVVPDTNDVVHAYVFDVDGGNSATDVPMPQNFGHLIAATRYLGGIAVLLEQHPVIDGGQGSIVLAVSKLPNDGTWSNPIPVTVPGDVGTVNASCVQRVVGTLDVRSAATDDYVIAFSYQEAALISPPQNCGAYGLRLKGAHVKGPPTLTSSQTWTVPSGLTAVDFPDDAFVAGANHEYVLFNPSSSGGPPPAGTSPYIVQSDVNTLAYQSALKVPLKNQQAFQLGAAIKEEPPDDAVGMAFFEANLGDANSKPTFYVGSPAPANVGGITPSAGLNATELGSVTELPVDHASYHWENHGIGAAASHDMLAIGRVYPTGAGFNFLWFDQRGRVRAQRTTGPSGGPLAKPTGSGVSLGAGITLLKAPDVQLANLQLVWIEDPGAGATYDVWTTQIGCVH